MDTTELSIRTQDRFITDLTAHLEAFVAGRGDGLLHVFVPHATAGLAVIETGSGTESDLADTIERVLPAQDIYRHRHGSAGHGRDHVLPAIISPSLSLPVIAGSVALGTWQSVVLVDPNADNPDRRVRVSFLAG